MDLGAKQFSTYIYIRVLGQLGLPLPFLMRPLRPKHTPPVRVAGQRRWRGGGGGGGIRCININWMTFNGTTTTIMATYASTSESAAATVYAGCTGDDHEHERENDRFVYV
jgi:hypothetical protein